jgi:DNA-binding MarR family transcriptional regulator
VARSQTPDFALTLRVHDSCLCLHVQRAARAVARRYDELLRPLGLNNGQFSLLMSLNRAEAASMGQVARVLAMDRTTLTANLKPLLRRGLLQIEVDDADRRSRRLRLTDAGHGLLARALPLWKRAQAANLQLVSNHDPGRLLAELLALS